MTQIEKQHWNHGDTRAASEGTTTMPTYSIIIPTYGRTLMLARAIESALAQTIDDHEIVVVDDSSPDPLDLPQSPRISILRTPHNVGPAAARNLGVEASTGEVITFLDDDDTWLPNRLRYAELGLGQAPIAICWQAKTGRYLQGNTHKTILDGTTPHLGCTAVMRSAWIPFDTSYRTCEDVVWWMDASSANQIATVPQQGLRYTYHDGPRSTHGTEQRIADSLRLLDERSSYFARHRRARAFRWKRIGLMRQQIGDYAGARRAFANSLRAHPTLPDAAHLVRSLRRS